MTLALGLVRPFRRSHMKRHPLNIHPHTHHQRKEKRVKLRILLYRWLRATYCPRPLSPRPSLLQQRQMYRISP